MNTPHVATVGHLREAGYRYRTVKQELRENLLARLRSDQPVLPGFIGYEDSVLPQLVHALLSRHDILFLGLRGQAKTRMIRALPSLLDEWLPVLADVEMPDDPLAPATAAGQRTLAQHGDDARVRWLHRNERYQEKLATPDVTIADLIGEIDIVKHAEGRYLSDESTMHLGLIPRANRGIFAINELPDLSPRIQVGLFNVLEERDVQVRGYPVRLRLDLCLVFSANPEDYTNRGRIVTPLKDRIGTVIRTHYPRTVEESMAVTRANAWLDRAGAEPTATPRVEVPHFMHRVLEEAVQLARRSPHINQASGVSVRTSIASLETLVSSAERRSLITGEPRVTARVSDLAHVVASCRGKIEMMMSEDGGDSEDKLLHAILGEAVKAVFDDVADVAEFQAVASQFTDGLTLSTGDDLPAADAVANFKLVPGLLPAAAEMARRLRLDPRDEQALACAGEFLLEGLYVNNRLSKAPAGRGNRYRR